MRLKAFVLSYLYVFVFTSAVYAAPSDSQGVALLVQSLNTSGVTNPVRPVQDFAASGSITYFWAGDEVQGAATVRARGADQFRLDANLPEGTRSVVFNRVRGALKESDGTVSAIPSQNVVNVGVLTYPFPSINAALNDPLTSVSYLGQTSVDGRPAYQVRVVRGFPPGNDPDGGRSRLCTKDYFFEASTSLLIKTQDVTYPLDNASDGVSHEVYFSDYRPVTGGLVPFSVTEKIGGQRIWTLVLQTVQFNCGLTDFDFQL